MKNPKALITTIPMLGGTATMIQTVPPPSAHAAGADSSAARGWAAKREADWRRALERYYNTGDTEDFDECQRLFGLWMITSRGLRRPTGKLSRVGESEQGNH